jgi:hypothetical protein
MTQTIHTFRGSRYLSGERGWQQGRGVESLARPNPATAPGLCSQKVEIKNKKPTASARRGGGLNPWSSRDALPHGVPRAHFFLTRGLLIIQTGNQTKSKWRARLAQPAFSKTWSTDHTRCGCCTTIPLRIYFLMMEAGGGLNLSRLRACNRVAAPHAFPRNSKNFFLLLFDADLATGRGGPR